MKIPFSYIFRNLWTRKLTTLLTAGGMALVVFVFAAVLMLDAGLKKTLVSTGSLDNAILLRQSSQTEIQSSVYRDQASLVETLPTWRTAPTAIRSSPRRSWSSRRSRSAAATARRMSSCVDCRRWACRFARR